MIAAPQRAARPAFALRQPAHVVQRRSLTSNRVCAQAGLQKEVLKAGDGATFPKTGQKARWGVGIGRGEAAAVLVVLYGLGFAVTSGWVAATDSCYRPAVCGVRWR